MGDELRIYKVEAMGDVVYLQADDLADAKDVFYVKFGDEIPSNLLTFTEVLDLPKGEEFI